MFVDWGLLDEREGTRSRTLLTRVDTGVNKEVGGAWVRQRRMKEKKGRRLRWEEVKKKLNNKGEAPFLWGVESIKGQRKGLPQSPMQ